MADDKKPQEKKPKAASKPSPFRNGIVMGLIMGIILGVPVGWYVNKPEPVKQMEQTVKQKVDATKKDMASTVGNKMIEGGQKIKEEGGEPTPTPAPVNK